MPYPEAIAVAAGLLMLTAALLVWRHGVGAATRIVAVQGAALAGLVATIGAHERDPELLLVAGLVLAVKAAVLPWVLTLAARGPDGPPVEPRANPVGGLMAVALLSGLAYVVMTPLVAGSDDPATPAVPAALAVVLVGLLILATRRHAVSQLVGFLVLDNGIAAVAFLVAGGVPLVVELGVSLDVVLVVLILRVLTGRMRLKFGDTDVGELRELRD